MWSNLASSNGNEQGMQLRHTIGQELSPQQMEKAQELSRNWKPTVKEKKSFNNELLSMCMKNPNIFINTIATNIFLKKSTHSIYVN